MLDYPNKPNALGNENQNSNKVNITIMSIVYYKIICRILGISIIEVIDEEITNEEVRRRFREIDTISEISWMRQFLFIRCIAQFNKGMYLPMILVVIVTGKYSKRRFFQAICDTFTDKPCNS